ncbi:MULTISPECIES: hypothetical protein [unclassified Brevundimonas]|uniref:hypothetical protein n=1 Tax=unclassified Brevundimonas TaxID=2622653 RepID=UPI0025C27544|nr:MULTISPECIES: hypothetical protein [unclassified Brevundimonas]
MILIFRAASIAATLAAAATPSLASPQFNLVCEGRRILSNDHAEPFTTTLRVDLERRYWCRDECAGALEIDTIGDAFVTFMDRPSLTIADNNREATPTKEYLGVSRENGVFAEMRWSLHGDKFSAYGRCEVAPFTGFPEVRGNLF